MVGEENRSAFSRRGVMLVLTRKPGEKLLLTGGITITVLRSTGGRIRLGVEAPDHVEVLRAELAGKARAPRRPVTKSR
jgi:carbon storage regulator